jgi:hypothetical protein
MIYGLLALLTPAASIHHHDMSLSHVIQSTNFQVLAKIIAYVYS